MEAQTTIIICIILLSIGGLFESLYSKRINNQLRDFNQHVTMRLDKIVGEQDNHRIEIAKLKNPPKFHVGDFVSHDIQGVPNRCVFPDGYKFLAPECILQKSTPPESAEKTINKSKK